MVYKFLKWFAAVGIKFYYKNVFINHEPSISDNKPVIYASNHPSGFYESLILATISKNAPIFLVRSDYVTIKGLMWLFKILKLYPIYRQSEGLKDVSKNNEVFNNLNIELANNTPICIYPEGTTRFSHKLNSIKKGVSRLAIGAINGGVKNLNIIPIAFNFVEPVKFRSSLFIYSGKALTIDYSKNHNENIPTKLRQLTEEIKVSMSSVVIDLKSKEHHELFKKAQELVINNEAINKKFDSYILNSELPKTTKNLSIVINKIEDEKFENILDKYNKYFISLDKINSNDLAVISANNTFLDHIKLFLGFPLYVLSLITNSLPILLALYIRKTKIKQYEYKAVVTVLLAQFTYLVYIILLLTTSIILFKYLGLIVMTLPILAWFALKYYDFKTLYKAKQHLSNHNIKKKYRDIRNELFDLLGIVNPHNSLD